MLIVYKKLAHVVFLLKSLIIKLQRKFVSQSQPCIIYMSVLGFEQTTMLVKTFFNGFIIISVESSVSPQSHSHPHKINKRVKFMEKYGLDSDTVIGWFPVIQ